MPESDEPPAKEFKTADVERRIIEAFLSDEEFKKSLGRRASYFVLTTLAIAIIKLTVGLPVITLASTPLAGALIVFFIAQVEDWARSKKPKVIFYLCQNEGMFIPIKWSSLSRYHKLRVCPHCGSELSKRCQQGKHF